MMMPIFSPHNLPFCREKLVEYAVIIIFDSNWLKEMILYGCYITFLLLLSVSTFSFLILCTF